MVESLIGFGAILGLAFLGIPLGVSMLLVGIAGFFFVRNMTAALSMAGQQVLDLSTTYGFTVLPLFVLMGTFIHRARLSEELYDATNAWLGHRRGGLAMATIGACAGFAAVSGSSLATAATMSKVAMAPMRRFRYADSLAAGTIAAGGTLGILIPPSVPMVIYGILTETDIGKLFVAGVLPGLLLVALYFGAIGLLTAFKPEMGPPGERYSWAARWRALGKVWGVVVLFVLVLGGIYLGIFTPTEAAAIGAAGAMVFAMGRRKLALSSTIDALIDAGRTTAMIFMVGFGALVFSNFINLAGLPDAMVALIQAFDVPVIGVILIICAIYVVLGCVLRQPRHAAADGARVLPDRRFAGRGPDLVRHRDHHRRRDRTDHAADRDERLHGQDGARGRRDLDHLQRRVALPRGHADRPRADRGFPRHRAAAAGPDAEPSLDQSAPWPPP